MVVNRLPQPLLVPGAVAEADLGLRLRTAALHALDVLGNAAGDGEQGSTFHTHQNPWGVKKYVTTDVSSTAGPYHVMRQLCLAHPDACDLLLYAGNPAGGPLPPTAWRVQALPLFGLDDFPDGVFSVPAPPDARDPYNHRITLTTPGLWVLDLYLDRYSAVDSLHVVPVNACGTESMTHAFGIAPTTGATDMPSVGAFDTLGGVRNAAWLRLARKVKEVQTLLYDPDVEGVGRHEHGAGNLANPTVLFASFHGMPAGETDTAVVDTATLTVNTTPLTVIDTEFLEGTNGAAANYTFFALVYAENSKSSVCDLVVKTVTYTTSAASLLTDLGANWHLLTGSFGASAVPSMTAIDVTQAATGSSQEVALVSFLIVREV